MRYQVRTGVLVPFVQKYYKLLILAIAGLFTLSYMVMTLTASAAKPVSQSFECETIKDGNIEYGRPTDPTDEKISLGVDDWGYNYQAHMFNGYYGNYTRPSTVATEGDWLQMKWNDAWLSNKDCVDQDGFDGDVLIDETPDGKLDRHLGFDSYRGSGAWITNHMVGTNVDGSKWTYFVKIVAVPEDGVHTVEATDACPKSEGLDAKMWVYTEDETEIGCSIWNQFAVLQEIYNDPTNDVNGVQRLSELRAGLGNW